MGKPAVLWCFCMVSSDLSPVCSVLLLFLSRLRRDRNAVMTNGRLWKDLLDNYHCFSSLNFPFVSHYSIWEISATQITPQILSFYLLALCQFVALICRSIQTVDQMNVSLTEFELYSPVIFICIQIRVDLIRFFKLQFFCGPPSQFLPESGIYFIIILLILLKINQLLKVSLTPKS